ncbi:MAG TPA: BadF/BadG/BcrA/BcrD ATPase family protein [Bacillales bacterium]|nr:BadF/BadG/BcrA/BcrD ATPase family protein [Bacillales bacterium]
MTRKWIGIDGGGTKTTCVIGDENGILFAHAAGDSGNIQSHSPERVKETLCRLIEEVLVKAGSRREQLAVIYLALAGADRREDKQRIDAFLNPYKRSFVDIVIENDAKAALAAGSWGEPGLVLIAGTGSIAYGFSSEKAVRVGGWGYLLGDEGSGYDIGRQALSAVLKQLDGRGPKTSLTEFVLEAFAVSEPEQLIPLVYGSPYVKNTIANLSALVFRAAKTGDAQAQAIVEAAVAELLELVRTAYCGMPAVGTNLVLSGGLFSNAFFKQAFVEKAGVTFGDLKVVDPAVSPAVGAYVLALRHSGMAITESLKKEIRQSWSLLQG